MVHSSGSALPVAAPSAQLGIQKMRVGNLLERLLVGDLNDPSARLFLAFHHATPEMTPNGNPGDVSPINRPWRRPKVRIVLASV